MNSQGSSFILSLVNEGIWFESRPVGLQSHWFPPQTPFPSSTVIFLGDSMPQPLGLSVS